LQKYYAGSDNGNRIDHDQEKRRASRHQARGAIGAPDDVSWKTALSKKSDKDEPMILTGTIFQPDSNSRRTFSRLDVDWRERQI